jgi:hypothetical protein
MLLFMSRALLVVGWLIMGGFFVVVIGVGEVVVVVVWLGWFCFYFLGPCPLWLEELVYARLSWFAYLQIYY